jgi:hypothetical protein
LQLVAREGTQAPGAEAGVVFLNIGGHTLNHLGGITFDSDLAGPGVTVANDRGVWRQLTGEALALSVRDGASLSGIYAGHVVQAPINVFPQINDAGQVAQVEYVGGVGSVLFVQNAHDNDVIPVIGAGDAAPGFPSGVHFSGFGRPALNGVGRVAFDGELQGPDINSNNFVGVWKQEADGSVRLVAREGDHAPGTPPNVRFDVGSGNNGGFNWIVLNGRGQVAFQAFLAGPGIGNPHSGIWAEDVLGELHLIARMGDLLEVAPNDFRTIVAMDLFGTFTGGFGNESGYSSGFNERGQVAFSASFTDGTSGIFVSDLVAVPEPSAFFLLSIGSASLLRRLHQRLRLHVRVVVHIPLPPVEDSTWRGEVR